MNAKQEALNILDNAYVGTMATVRNNKPHSRYMTFFNDEFTIYTATSKKTTKVEEIENNPYTHILIGYQGKGLGDDYLEIEGKVSLSRDEGMIEKVWNDDMDIGFDGPKDPDLIILKITPINIRLMNTSGEAPKEVEL